MLKFTETNKAATKVGAEFRDALRDKLSTDGTNATKSLSKSISYKKEKNKKDVSVGVTWFANNYWEMVEYGSFITHTNPKGSGRFSDNIEKWIEKKPISDIKSKKIRGIRDRKTQIKALGFAIMKKIQEEGVNTHPFVEPTKELMTPKIEKQLQDAIILDFTRMITEKLKNTK